MNTGISLTAMEILVILFLSGIFSFAVVTVLRGLCIAIYHLGEIIKEYWEWR